MPPQYVVAEQHPLKQGLKQNLRVDVTDDDAESQSNIH